MVDRAFKLNVGRQGFGSVNPEIWIIEGRIIEVLLYMRDRVYFVHTTENVHKTEDITHL